MVEDTLSALGRTGEDSKDRRGAEHSSTEGRSLATPKPAEASSSLDDTLAAVEPATGGGSPDRASAREVDVLGATGASSPRPPDAAGPRPSQRLGRGDEIDRYVILSQLGAGGMGVVYVAYDPELDRKVALKLMLPDCQGSAQTTEGRTRLVREAQALARLNHPNVVAVHDVGTLDDSVWIAMEFVEGRTLGSWAEQAPRSWLEILAIMRQAGLGLQASHDAGLLHRDFKPDNVMVGVDGRVRVMDFGLARSRGGTPKTEPTAHELASLPARVGESALDTDMTAGGALLGTPAYMSPEQWLCTAVDARSDQFSFCVTLWELLYRERPFEGDTVMSLMSSVLEGQRRPVPPGHKIPAWLRRVVDRGLARDPEERHPDMAALLAGMNQARTRQRLRRAGLTVAAAGVIAAGVFAYSELDRARRRSACEAEGARVDELWNADVRMQVTDAFEASGQPHGRVSAERVGPWLDDHADRWRRAQTEACLATDLEHRWDEDTSARAQWCLDEHHAALDATITAFLEAESTTVDHAVDVAAGLQPPDACIDAAALLRAPAPPRGEIGRASQVIRTDLAAVEVAYDTGRYAAGLKLAESVSARAQELGWAPLSAAALTAQARLLRVSGSYEESKRIGARAYMEAARAGAWDVAGRAATTLVALTGFRMHQRAEAEAWARDAQLAIEFAGDPLRLRRADLLNNLAMLEASEQEHERAIELFQETLALRREALGAEHPRMSTILGNIATMRYRQGRYEEAEQLFHRSLEIAEASFGAEHPTVGLKYNNLGRLLIKVNELERAHEVLERALEIRRAALPSGHADIGQTLHNLARLHLASENLGQAKRAAEEAATIREHAPHHAGYPSTMLLLAKIETARNDTDAARRVYGRILDMKTDLADLSRFDTLELLLALERKAGDDAEATRVLGEAITVARRLRDGFRAEGKQEEVEELDRWLRANTPDQDPPPTESTNSADGSG